MRTSREGCKQRGAYRANLAGPGCRRNQPLAEHLHFAQLAAPLRRQTRHRKYSRSGLPPGPPRLAWSSGSATDRPPNVSATHPETTPRSDVCVARPFRRVSVRRCLSGRVAHHGATLPKPKCGGCATVSARPLLLEPPDANRALGYAGLADVDQTLCIMWGPSPSYRSFLREAANAAQHAIAIEPSSAEAQTSYASVQELMHDRYGVADAHYLLALAANPRYAPAHLRYGVSLLLRRQLKPAIAHLRLAAQLEPASVITTSWLATALYIDRQPLAATTYANEMKYLGAGEFYALSTLGLIYAEEKRYDAARRVFTSLRSCCPIITGALLAQVDAQSGRRRLARAELPSAKQAAEAQIWVDVAFAQVLLNERSAALASLERAHLTGAMDRSLVALDPRMESVRRDRRFVKLLQE